MSSDPRTIEGISLPDEQAEGSSTASFARQQDTYLNVAGSGAIRKHGCR